MYSSVPSPPTQGPAPALLDRTRSFAVSPPPGSPTSPVSRTGRLRGLSYLRNYTQTHLLSRDHSTSHSTQQRPHIGRASSYPSPTSIPSESGAATPSSPTPRNQTRQPSPAVRQTENAPATTRSSNPDTGGSPGTSTSGWLPSVGGQSGVSRIAAGSQAFTTSSSSAVLSANGAVSDLTASMARTRSATVENATGMPQADGAGEVWNEARQTTTNGSGNGLTHQLPSIRFTAHQDPRAQRPSLVFSPMARILPTGKEVIKVGRYSERDNQPAQAANVPSSSPVGFKSKVVSRRHCEFWCSGGRWFIKDVKSSSGTFLNHIRLSSPGTESRPFPVNDGDIVQLGIDFKGGEEMIFRCVKIRVELNKGWQNGPSSFNVQSHKRLRELNKQAKPAVGVASGSSQDCSICLGPIAPCQSLFVAPCSHTWHYKCIRVIINGPHWPHFICPNCRSVADLEAELEDPYADGDWEELANTDSSAQLPEPVQPIQPAANLQPQELEPESVRQQDPLESSCVSNEPARASESVQSDHNVSSDNDLGAVSDDSGISQRAQETAERLRYLSVDADESPSASSAEDPHLDQISNSTVAPVDILSRKPVSSLAARSLPRERAGSRTASQNGLPSSMNESATVIEGPLTPRNDAGPFIFDGSAGRDDPDDLAPINLNAAADTASQKPAAQPVS